jgi:hypothetical protein
MSKLRTTPTHNPQHRRVEEFHQKLGKVLQTATAHRQKVQQEAQLLAEPDRGHGHSQAAHLTIDAPVKPQAKRPVGDPNVGQHPGASLKR